jgi:hypothetical protein
VSIEVQAWGVFRDGKLVSGVNGVQGSEARQQATALCRFNPPGVYVAKAIPHKRVRADSVP